MIRSRKNILYTGYALAILATVFGASIALASAYSFTPAVSPSDQVTYDASSGDTTSSTNSYVTSASPVATLPMSGATFDSTYTNPPAGGADLPTDASGNTICDDAATNAGLSKSTKYWCVTQADWTTGSSGGVYFGGVCEGDGYETCGDLSFTISLQDVTATVYTSKPSTYTENYVYNSTDGEESDTWSPSSPPTGQNGCYSMSAGNYSIFEEGYGSGALCTLETSIAQTPPAVTLSVSPNPITLPAGTMLSWTSSNATACSVNNGIGSVALNSSQAVYPTATTTYTITCTGMVSPSATSSVTVAVNQPPAPTGTLTATPSTITLGGSATLNWSSTNATSCTGTNFSTSGAVSGLLSVSPTSTTNYSVTCTGAGGTSSPATATVTVNIPAITGSCSVSPSTATTGVTVTWSASVSGGNGTYAYAWTLPNGTPSSGSGSSIGTSYATSGTQTATVVITSGGQSSGTVNCSNSVAISYPTLTASCSVSPTTANADQNVTWSSTASGGTGSYTYSWSAPSASPSTGTASSLTTSYASGGTFGTSLSVTSGTQTVNPTCSNSVTVSAPAQPDITSTIAPTPSTATVGTAQTFTGTNAISNIGNATGSNFPNVLQVADASDNPITYVAVQNLTLAASASGSVSGAYTFTSAGTYNVRWCGNMNTSGTNVITESNYGNNCGPWDTVTATASVPLSTTCSVSPTTIAVGGSATWTATPSGGRAPYTYIWIATGGNPPGGTASSLTPSYSSSGTYNASVVVTDANNNSTPTTNCSNSLTVSSAPIATLSASPTSITSGSSSTLTWGSTNATSCTATNFSTGGATSGTLSVSPTTTTTYSTTCTGAGGTSSPATATVTVTTPEPDITSTIAPTPSTATVNTAQTFTGTNAIKNIGNATGTNFPNELEVANSSDVLISYISAGNLTLAASASGSVSASYTFTSAGTYNVRWCGNMNTSGANVITESNYGNNCGPWDTVTVGTTPTATLSANPTSVASGSSSTLTWSSTNATSCTGTNFSTGNATSGTLMVTPASTTTYSVTCTGAGGTSSPASATVTVTGGLPDVTATVAPSPSTATYGSSVTFTGTNAISNIGSSTASNFPSVLEVATTGGTVLGYGAASPATLTLVVNASGSVSTTSTETLPVGSYKIRWCGNMNTSGTNVITESNYGNNCGPWTTLTVTNASSASVSCSPSPTSAAPGATVTWTPVASGFSGTVTYNWTAPGGTPSSGSGSVFSNSYASSGSYAAGVSATDKNGDNANASCTPVTVTLAGGSCSSPAAGTIIASPNRVSTTNTGTTLSFSASGIPTGDSCSISGPGLTPDPFTTSVADASCNIATSTAATSALTTQGVYTMTCTGWTGQTTAVVNITPAFQEF